MNGEMGTPRGPGASDDCGFVTAVVAQQQDLPGARIESASGAIAGVGERIEGLTDRVFFVARGNNDAGL